MMNYSDISIEEALHGEIWRRLFLIIETLPDDVIVRRLCCLSSTYPKANHVEIISYFNQLEGSVTSAD